MKNMIRDFIKNEDGVTAIEYAMIGVAMAVLLGALFKKDGEFGKGLTDAFQDIATKLKQAGTA
ncbi:Flp family type IVb pilin [Vibrio navarrensis]